MVAINSFCDEDGAYSHEVMTEYIQAGAERGDTEPHIFSVGKEVYYRLLSTQKNQAVIITGESGAGKSFSAKKVLEFLAEVSAANAKETQVAANIIIANPILEAFGNAKMPRNDDSSRFGKLFKIIVDPHGAIVGCNIETYLLEKSRVCRHGHKERNFHIFYMLLAYLAEFSPDWMDSLELPSLEASYYKYLAEATAVGEGELTSEAQDDIEIKMEEDADRFQCLIDALTVCGFSEQDQEKLWLTLSVVMKLGNITFIENADGKSAVEDMEAVEAAAKAFGVGANEMAEALCTREFQNPTPKKQHEFIKFKVSTQMANQNRDALSKTIYSGMFDEVVRRVNLVFVEDDGSMMANPANRMISVLDIFGFEVLNSNSLEQLLINYANEQLHDYFSRHMYAEQIELLQRETTLGDAGVSYFYEHVNEISTEQRNRVALLRDTLLGTSLDEVCAHPRGTDPDFMGKLKEVGDGEFLKLGIENVDGEDKATTFTVKHFAEDVTYMPEGFVDKNKFKLYSNLVKMVQSGSNEFVIEVVNTDYELGSMNMFQRFQQSLTSLIDLLDNSAPRFIRCLKSNMKKREWEFEPEIVHRQLIYASLLQTVKICTMGFPEQHLFKDFYINYRMLFYLENPAMQKWEASTNCCQNPDGLDDEGWKQGLEFILSGCMERFGERTAGLIKLGQSEVLLREEASQALDAAKSTMQKDATANVLAVFFMQEERRQFKRQQAATSIQTCCLATIDRPPFAKHCLMIDLQCILLAANDRIANRANLPEISAQTNEEMGKLEEAEAAAQALRDEQSEEKSEEEIAAARKKAEDAAAAAGNMLGDGKGPKKLKVPEQYKTLRAALKASNHGDIIDVSPGTYAEAMIIDKAVHIRGTQRLGVLITVNSQTALQLQCENPEHEATLANLTIQIKNAENNHNAVSVHSGKLKVIGCGFFGGFCGMLVHRGSSAELRNSIVRNCSAGVVVDSGSEFRMMGCRVHGNKRCGIAILGDGSTGHLEKNEIHGNEGFAVGVWRKAKLFMEMNKVRGNEKGGVYVHGQGTSATIKRNKFGSDGSWQVAGKAKLVESDNDVEMPAPKLKDDDDELDREDAPINSVGGGGMRRDRESGPRDGNTTTAAGRKIIRVYLSDGTHNALAVEPTMTARDVCKMVATKKLWLKDDPSKDEQLIDGLALYETSSVPVNYRRRLLDNECPVEVMSQWASGRSHKFVLNTKRKGKPQSGKSQVVRIYIVDGTHVSLSLPCGATVRQTCEMLAAKRSADKAKDGEVQGPLSPLWDTFTLYEVNYAQDGSSSSWRSLGDEEVVQDVMASSPKGVSSLFLFKKRMFLPDEKIMDDGYLHITYLQVITALRSRLYGSPAKPFKQTLCDTDLVNMAALHMYYMLGPSDGDNTTLSLLWRTMQACVPNGVWKAYSPGATRACEQYAELALDSQNSAAKELIRIAQKYPHFGREFFPVRGHNPPIAIGIGYEGMLIVHAVTRAPISTHLFSDLSNWRATTDEMVTTHLEYQVNGSVEKYTTPDAYEIVLLLDKYKEVRP